MGKNIIFVFSGIGNSLWCAKKISEELENCEIVSMGRPKKYTLTDEYGVIGFAYPTYYRGIPAKVEDFVLHCDFQNNKNAYFLPLPPAGVLIPPATRQYKCAICSSEKGSRSAILKSLTCFQTILFFMTCVIPPKKKRGNRPAIWSQS